MRTRPLAVQVDTLKRAWALATEHHSTSEHVAQAHEVISHCDGSSCDGGATCGIIPDGLLAYELAFEIADMHGVSFVDYVAAFANRDEQPESVRVERRCSRCLQSWLGEYGDTCPNCQATQCQCNACEERPNAADVEAIAREYPRLGIR